MSRDPIGDLPQSGQELNMDKKGQETELLLVRWFDSAVGPATAVYTPEEITAEKLIVLETVGWLVAETSEPYGGHYTLAATKHGDSDWRGIQLIPKANVIGNWEVS